MVRRLGDSVPGICEIKQNQTHLVTPVCKCGVNDGWVVRREMTERETWSPLTGTFHDMDLECIELDIFCSACGYDANWADDNALYILLTENT